MGGGGANLSTDRIIGGGCTSHFQNYWRGAVPCCTLPAPTPMSVYFLIRKCSCKPICGHYSKQNVLSCRWKMRMETLYVVI